MWRKSRHPSSTDRILVTFLFVTLSLAAPFGLLAQEELTGNAAETETTSFLITDFARGEEEAFALARGVRRVIVSAEELQAAELELARFERVTEQEEANLERVDLQRMHPAVIQKLWKRWDSHQKVMDLWHRTLGHRLGELEEQRSRVESEIERWETALKTVEESEELDPIQDRVDLVIATLEEAKGQLAAGAESYVPFLDSAVVLGDRVRTVRNRLEDSGADFRERLLERGSVPLWEVAREAGAGNEGLPLQREGVSDEIAEVIQHLSTTEGTTTLHLLLTIFLVGLAALVGIRSRKWTIEADLRRVADIVLLRPIATGSLLGLLATSLLYDQSQSRVADLALILTVIPLLRLLPDLVGPTARRAVFAILLVETLHLAINTSLQDVSVRRFGFLVTSLLGLGLAVWVLSRLKKILEEHRAFWPWLFSLLLSLSALVLTAAVALNTLGWFLFSEVLTDGVFSGIYAGLVLTVLARILGAVVLAFPESPTGKRSRIFTEHAALVTGRTLFVLRFTLLVLWCRFTLMRFFLLRPLTDALTRLRSSEFKVGTLTVAVDGVVSALLVLILTYFFARLLRFILEEEILPRMGVRRGVALAVSAMIYYAVFAFGLVGSAGALGLGASNLTLMASALGVGIGFGLQTVVNNFVSGLILIFERPIKVGDLVQLGTTLGEVQHIGIRASRIRTFEGAEVVYPNGKLISQELTNWTLSDLKRRRNVDINVVPGADPQRVIDILAEAATSVPAVLSEPSPAVLFLGYVDGTQHFSLRFWTRIDGSLGAMSAVGLAVDKALAAGGIEIAKPQRELLVTERSTG